MTNRQYRFELDEGPVEISIPTELSVESYEDTRDFFALVTRRLTRRIKRPEERE